MRLLLDSHALFWALGADPSLSETARAAILDDGTEVFFSPASLYELAFMANRGRAPAEALALRDITLRGPHWPRASRS